MAPPDFTLKIDIHPVKGWHCTGARMDLDHIDGVIICHRQALCGRHVHIHDGRVIRTAPLDSDGNCDHFTPRPTNSR